MRLARTPCYAFIKVFLRTSVVSLECLPLRLPFDTRSIGRPLVLDPARAPPLSCVEIGREAAESRESNRVDRLPLYLLFYTRRANPYISQSTRLVRLSLRQTSYSL